MALRKDEEFKGFKTEEVCGIVSDNGNGNTLELLYGSWGEGKPKYDLRRWYVKDGEKRAAKGITLSGEELEELGKLIMKMMEEE